MAPDYAEPSFGRPYVHPVAEATKEPLRLGAPPSVRPRSE